MRPNHLAVNPEGIGAVLVLLVEGDDDDAPVGVNGSGDFHMLVAAAEAHPFGPRLDIAGEMADIVKDQVGAEAAVLVHDHPGGKAVGDVAGAAVLINAEVPVDPVFHPGIRLPMMSWA